MEKVLITGGCGFIGSHIVEELEKKYKVTVVDNLSTGNYNNILSDVEFYNSDITTSEFRDLVRNIKPDYIIHQAGQVSVTNSINDILNDQNENIKGSINVLEAARENKTKKIIFASSAAVYGTPNKLPISTLHPTVPLSPYGLSKNTVENYIILYKKMFDLNYTILRYSNVYGPRQNINGEGGVISHFFKKLLNHEKPSVYGDGKQTRDFVYVKDVARANLKAIQGGHEKILNVSSSTSTSIIDLLSLFSSTLKREVKPIYYKERMGEIRHSILCNRETMKLLNWEPKYTLEMGLLETYRSFISEVSS
ncbi:NAD-dependent epimerase/dehydratase family protein [Cytobacillus praedii]|uniref:NAD-dependent epimerase/dehydratase family protein n=1 Tax=Cytobacillus praedii TaxID=1742358 RepID=UPI003AF50E9E